MILLYKLLALQKVENTGWSDRRLTGHTHHNTRHTSHTHTPPSHQHTHTHTHTHTNTHTPVPQHEPQIHYTQSTCFLFMFMFIRAQEKGPPSLQYTMYLNCTYFYRGFELSITEPKRLSSSMKANCYGFCTGSFFKFLKLV